MNIYICINIYVYIYIYIYRHICLYCVCLHADLYLSAAAAATTSHSLNLYQAKLLKTKIMIKAGSMKRVVTRPRGENISVQDSGECSWERWASVAGCFGLWVKLLLASVLPTSPRPCGFMGLNKDW